MQCTVCKCEQSLQRSQTRRSERQHFDPNFPDFDDSNSSLNSGRNGSKWLSTKERTSCTQMRIAFKLFDCLKREFNEGFVCSECVEILEQIDSLQFQACELIKELRNRVDTYFGDADRSFEAPTARKRVKREIEDDEYDAFNDNFNDTASDPDFTLVSKKDKPATSAKKTSKSLVKIEGKRQVLYKNEFWEKVNDEAYVKDVLRKKRFDYDLTVIATIQNTEHLIYDGAIWHPATFREFKTDKLVHKWVCGKSHHFSYRCVARVATTADKQCVIEDSKYMEHNHELDPEEIKFVLLKNRVKEIALNHPEMTPIGVLKTVEMMNDDMDVSISHSSILKYITRIQDRHGIPRKPRERKPGYVPRKRKRPLTKWKKTPSQLAAEKKATEDAAVASTQIEEVEEVGDEDQESDSEMQQVQHIIIQPTGDQSVIVQQTNADGTTSVPVTTAYTTTTIPQATTFQIEYTGHVPKE